MRYQRWTETSCLSWVIKTSQRERLMDFLFLDGLVCRWCLTRKWLRLSKENILTFNEWYTRTKKMTPPRPGRCQDLKVGCICFFTTIQIFKAKHQSGPKFHSICRQGGIHHLHEPKLLWVLQPTEIDSRRSLKSLLVRFV